MKLERLNTTMVLIDLQYYAPMNKFEEEFGDHVTYAEFEQKSYIEFKSIMFTKICDLIRFRKLGRIGPVLTIKADMLSPEIEKFKKLIENNSIKFLFDWTISNVTIIKDQELSAKLKLSGQSLEEELAKQEESEEESEDE